MKTHIKKLFLLPALIAGPGLLLAVQAEAQTFTNLYSFTNASPRDFPEGGVILAGNTLYGTTEYGGLNDQGTVFAVNTDGTGFTNLYNFSASTRETIGGYYYYTNSDGAQPETGVILAGNTLYGTTLTAGSGAEGTVFAVNTDGTGFTNLHRFSAWVTNGLGGYTNSDGAQPGAGLVLSGNTLYGTAQVGGANGLGAIFAINTDGTGFTNMHSFSAESLSAESVATNSDGADPLAGLTLSGNTLYGTTHLGGIGGNGTVFAINTDGTGFTNLHSVVLGAFGYGPEGTLALSGNTLYGTMPDINRLGNGLLFSVNTDGTGFTNLYSFASGPSGVILSGNTLYGTTPAGGANGDGTIFAINTDGMGFTNLCSSFIAGAGPSGVILSGNTLYGTESYGGTLAGYGAVFAFSLPAPLAMGIATAGNQIVLSWPTNATGVNLQSINSLSSGTWSNVSSGITIVGANYVFTNAENGSAAFFRLMRP